MSKEIIPDKFTWQVSCKLPDELQKAEKVARSEAILDKEIVTRVQYGWPLITDEYCAYLLDYFSKVEVHYESEIAFCLVFYLKKDYGERDLSAPTPLQFDRFWKDIMVRILSHVRESARDVSIHRIE